MGEHAGILLLGGRSGVGKTSVGHEIHAQLMRRGVRHALIDGDYLAMAHPAPDAFGIAESNLGLVWANYEQHGYRNLVYSQTVSVIYSSELLEAMGGTAQTVGVLLTSSDETAHARLSRRETGSELAIHIERSTLMARRLEAESPSWVHRISTDDRSVQSIASEVIDLTNWS
ncbi:shikimate kinase [Marisediminicola sp. UYEF4]|uniref:ATPase n=1 Tax=Marisediminicola sp. UYEF4 TaxID=1756384 RepID=UPI003399C661